MEADIKFFDNAKKSCINKHDLWVERQRLRKQEARPRMIGHVYPKNFWLFGSWQVCVCVYVCVCV